MYFSLSCFLLVVICAYRYLFDAEAGASLFRKKSVHTAIFLIPCSMLADMGVRVSFIQYLLDDYGEFYYYVMKKFINEK
jgi:hypothetical protein